MCTDDLDVNEILNGVYSPAGKASLPESLANMCGHTMLADRLRPPTTIHDKFPMSDSDDDLMEEKCDQEVDSYFESCRIRNSRVGGCGSGQRGVGDRREDMGHSAGVPDSDGGIPEFMDAQHSDGGIPECNHTQDCGRCNRLRRGNNGM